MADISALGTLNNADPISDDIYADVKPFRPAPAGRYTLLAPDADDLLVGRTKANDLRVQIDPTIAGPTNEGQKVQFAYVSNKTFDRNGATVSMIGDYLRACGFPANLSGDPQEAADAVEQTAELTYEAELDWELYAAGHGPDGTVLSIKGMRNFPMDDEGFRTHVVPSQFQVDEETGEPVMLTGRLRIRRFYSAV